MRPVHRRWRELRYCRGTVTPFAMEVKIDFFEPIGASDRDLARNSRARVHPATMQLLESLECGGRTPSFTRTATRSRLLVLAHTYTKTRLLGTQGATGHADMEMLEPGGRTDTHSVKSCRPRRLVERRAA